MNDNKIYLESTAPNALRMEASDGVDLHEQEVVDDHLNDSDVDDDSYNDECDLSELADADVLVRPRLLVPCALNSLQAIAEAFMGRPEYQLKLMLRARHARLLPKNKNHSAPGCDVSRHRSTVVHAKLSMLN